MISPRIADPVFTFTVDQASSRTGRDRVPHLLEQLQPFPTLLPFERTAGDEIQGVIDQPDALVACAETILRAGSWHLGIGIGAIDTPLPTSTRAARGPAFLNAREAVTKAKRAPHRLSVVCHDLPVCSVAVYLETALGLWAGLLGRRTERGWQVADLIADGLTHAEIGRRLEITQSAVTQRAAAAQVIDADRTAELVRYLAAQIVIGSPRPSTGSGPDGLEL